MKDMKKTSFQPTDGEQLDEGTFRSEQTAKGDNMKKVRKVSKHFFVALALVATALVAFQLIGTEALAQSSYFTSRGCTDCHGAPTVATCNGCHHHGDSSLKAATNKTSYAPGETVTATLSGGSRTGWIRAVLYDQNNTQIAISNGNASGMGSSTTFPAALTAPAPTTPGTYTWKMAYFGNLDGDGAGDVHGEVTVNTNSFTVAAPGDTVAPVVTFTLPATATSLIVPVSSLSATDNAAVTGYLINTSTTPPAASAAGWTATAPTSVIAVAGSNTFFAWAKDAAGNVSAVKSATVVVTIADTTVPVVATFTLPTTATSLNVPVSAFTATDNVAVTGYMITTSATLPAASSANWLAAAPAVATAPAAGVVTFRAWVKDAAGNVSAAKSATTTITISTADTTPPTLTVSTLANGSLTNKVTLNVSGNASDAGIVQSVTVNGQAVGVNADGSFSTALNLIAGSNVITVVAADQAGNQTTNSRTVTYDPAAPVLTVTDPADNSTTTQSFIDVSGTVNENSTVTVRNNNGSPQSATMNGNSFSATVNLTSGINTIDIDATDLAGNSANAKRSVTFSPGVLSLAVTDPPQDITTNQSTFTIQGAVSNALTPVAITITADGQTYTPQVTNGGFTQTITFTSAKTYAVTVSAMDQAGNQNTVQRNIIYAKSAGGDVNGDGTATIADALMLLKIAVAMIPMDNTYLAEGDIAPYVGGISQPDGKIDISDALLLLRKCVGLVNF